MDSNAMYMYTNEVSRAHSLYPLEDVSRALQVRLDWHIRG